MSAPDDAAEPRQSTPGPGRAARALVKRAKSLRAAIVEAQEAPGALRREARQIVDAARDEQVRTQLAAMPLSRVREATPGLRLGSIEAAGYTTVASVGAADRYRLEQLPGVGSYTASEVIEAVKKIEATLRQHVRVRFDPQARPPLQTKLLAVLRQYQLAAQGVRPLADSMGELAPPLDSVLPEAARASSRLKMFFSSAQRRAEAREALARLDEVLAAPATVGTEARLHELRRAAAARLSEHDLWEDYRARAAVYNGLLAEVSDTEPAPEAAQGLLPADLAASVHTQPLDTSLLTVSLRGYQAFGAKFALLQGKSILGDEMGLGKTIEALAAMAHLHRAGERHFLVICPASVLINWAHEVERHSALQWYRLHGAERARNYDLWVSNGGVAITTYGTLQSLQTIGNMRLGLLVVDEAHFVKNPEAARTRAVRQASAAASRTLFLTGTPMENRVEEFRTLVSHLRPDVAGRINALDGLAGAAAFRRAVAPVYLRRNQVDVLDELPERIEAEDWVELRGGDFEAYRAAVASGNFMAMRRAAYAPARVEESAKLARLEEIVDEALSNGRKVVVFSFFRDVLRAVADLLGDRCIGEISGSVAPVERQRLVDAFTELPGAAVLVSQIEAGGVGMNMQAASVVILTEPQWKPSTEEQAIARSHRMGQIYPVEVHRLLAEDTVDQRMREVLAAKTALFDEYARRSEAKERNAAAVDISVLPAARETVNQAEAERQIIETERRRLGITGPPVGMAGESEPEDT